MKTLALGVLAFLFVASVATAAPEGKSYSGEIMDSQCAQMGSHDAMMKSMSAANAKDCTEQCVKMGGKYVLFDAAHKTTYQLDDQKKPAKFAGQKVTVTGSLNGKILHVEKIAPAS